ncbi:MAG TPA: type VI secretion system tube protein Hcp [Geobacter sp.]|nr:type VI secretion system tube protein Hcp [Geobacter sp.]
MSVRQARKFVETATIIAALSLTLTGYAFAATDMFLKVDGIKGESVDSKHKDEIEILAWSWGASNSGNAHMGGGGGSGKVNVQDISITKYVDKASPLLMKKVCQGDHIKEMYLVVRKAGAKPLEYLKIKLEDCLVSSVSTGGSGGQDRLTENISFNFAKFQMQYIAQDAKGAAAGEVPFAFDIKANKSL